ncbi:MAG: SpoIID/LytB domain-containing protein [Actinomycetota bacterium]
MRSRIARLLGLLFIASSLAASAGAQGVAAAPAPSAGHPGSVSPLSTVQLQGHGWGHGRGMGQYGALGYAIDEGWSYTQILSHFYGGTTLDSIGDPTETVDLSALDGSSTTLVQERAELQTSANSDSGSYSALRAVLTGPNTFEIDQGSGGCAGPWTPLATSVTGPVTFSSAVPTPTTSTDHTDLIQACTPSGTEWYRGSIESVDSTGAGSAQGQRTVNVVAMDDYLLGVVPSESPSSWGALGNGAGEQALDAQAVAARSYAAAQNRSSYAKICDSTACQVYQGMAVQNGSSFRTVENPATTSAVLTTSGQALQLASGGVASAEYSSSTGGYSAGGVFPAVVDGGDSVSLNPYHSWSVTLSVSSIQNAYPSIGSLEALQVTQRNGDGDFGGRVEQMVIQGSAGNVTTTGDGFAAALGLRSDWFSVAYPQGYWVVGADGGIFNFGGAGFYGSAGGLRLARPIVGMESTPDGAGYWLVASDGGIFNYGDASFLGSTGGMHLNKPIVGMATSLEATPASVPAPVSTPTPSVTPTSTVTPAPSSGLTANATGGSTGAQASSATNGYWLVASDGGIFNYGDAHFYGSTGGMHLNQPIVGMAATPDGGGYWLVASDGGIFSYGDAHFYGSTGSIKLNRPIVGMEPAPDGQGYWLVASDGGIFNYGDAPYFGSVPGVAPASKSTKVGMAASGPTE